MNRFLTRCCVGGFLALLAVVPSSGQKSGSQGSQQPPSGGAAPNSQGQQSPRQSAPQMQTPLYVNGRVLMDTGQPVPEPVSVGLSCGMGLLQVIRTDLKGYFQFTLGAGPQGNMAFNASDDVLMGSGANGISGTRIPGGYGGFGDLTGCELRVSVDGYQPLDHPLTGPPELGTIDVGTLQLRRIAGMQGSAISVTSMLVPSSARKEFEKGDKEARNNKLQPATEHLQKAVAEYDNYAAAWSELGRIYAATHEMEKARQAFEKAIAADPKYVPPYVSLATLEIQNQEYESAFKTAGEALQLNPSLEVANFLQAVSNFRLNRLDEAQKSAEEVEKGPHQNLSQVHALLSDIFIQKQDYSSAAAQMRAYLKESPKGPFAAQMKKNLDELEASITTAESDSKSSAAQPRVAP
jgi:cytochrome c-type biogenesis protein CcmH/NrfG